MDALGYLERLVAFESTSCLSNAPISDYCQEALEDLGFGVERLEYADSRGVSKVNLVAKKGEGDGGVAWFGHTDVVPAPSWFRPEPGPFAPLVEDGRFFARGSCDMKGPLACMLAAAAAHAGTRLREPVYIVCTADEEVGHCGAADVVRRSRRYREMVGGRARGIIGEPTGLEVVHAHKGSYGFTVISRGEAAHSSGARGCNANLAMIPFLSEMKRIHDETEADPAWRHPAFDPPSVSWNIGINDHTAAVNIKPARSVCTVYFRPMPGQDGGVLIERAREAALHCGLEFRVMTCAEPLWTDPGAPFVREMLDVAGRAEARTVCYGTDGALFREMETLVVFGPGDIAQAHTDNEWISLDQLRRGTEAYGRLIERWCAV